MTLDELLVAIGLDEEEEGYIDPSSLVAMVDNDSICIQRGEETLFEGEPREMAIEFLRGFGIDCEDV